MSPKSCMSPERGRAGAGEGVRPERRKQLARHFGASFWGGAGGRGKEEGRENATEAGRGEWQRHRGAPGRKEREQPNCWPEARASQPGSGEGTRRSHGWREAAGGDASSPGGRTGTVSRGGRESQRRDHPRQQRGRGRRGRVRTESG